MMKVSTATCRARTAMVLVGCAALLVGCAGSHRVTVPAVTVPATTLNAGWWTVAPSQPNAQVLNSLRFSADSTTLETASRTVVADLAGQLPRVGVITIAGHTAATNTPAANREFSASRAGSVRAVLVAAGVPLDHIVVVGCGQDYPAPAGKHQTMASQQAANRRVTVWSSAGQLSRDQACR